MDKKLWQSSTNSILMAIKLYYVCSIVAAVFGMTMFSFVPVIGPLGKMAAGASVVGAFGFMYGLKAFKEAVNPADAPAVGKLHISLILIVCSIFINLIPLAGWIIAAILNLVSFVFMFLGYKGLKESETFSSPAKEGAAKLVTAMILACVAAIVSIIPVAGTPIAAVVNIVVFVFVLGGWNLIAAEQSVAPVASEPVKEIEEPKAE